MRLWVGKNVKIAMNTQGSVGRLSGRGSSGVTSRLRFGRYATGLLFILVCCLALSVSSGMASLNNPEGGRTTCITVAICTTIVTQGNLPDFELSLGLRWVEPRLVNTSFTIDVSRTIWSHSSVLVTLSHLASPPDTWVYFNGNGVNTHGEGLATISGMTPFTAFLDVAPIGEIPPGTYSITVKAVGSNGQTQTTTFTIVIQ